jgi:hypothetical protein
VPIEVRRGDKRCFGGALRLAVVGRYADGGCSDGLMTPEGGELGDTSTLTDPSVFEATRASKHHREMTRFPDVLADRAASTSQCGQDGAVDRVPPICRWLINCQTCQRRDVLTLGIAKTAGGVSSTVQPGMCSSAPERAVLVDTALRSPAAADAAIAVARRLGLRARSREPAEDLGSALR